MCKQINKPNVAAHNLFLRYRRDAVKRGLDFSLSEDDFMAIATGTCIYCGSCCESIHKNHGHYVVYTGVDRLDNRIGYTNENSVSCCKLCNYFKSTLSVETFLEHAQRIVAYQKRI